MKLKELIRLVKLSRKIMIYSFLGSLEYRLQTAIRILRMVFESVTVVFVISSFFQNSSTLAGMTKETVLLTFATFNLVWATLYFFISDNLIGIDQLIKKGTLDGMLLKPVDNQFMISCHQMHPQNAIRILIGLGILVYSFNASHLTFSVPLTMIYIIDCIAGLVIGYSMLVAISTMAFWTMSNEIYELVNTTFNTARYPLGIFPPKIVTVLTVLPLIFISTVPSRVLLGQINFLTILSPIVAMTLFMLSRSFLFFALRRYSSASS